MAASPELDRPRARARSSESDHASRALPLLAGGVGAAVLVVLLARPLLFTHADPGWDRYIHLWYLWHEVGSLRANGMPSLFVHDTTAVFNPHFAFYGGTLHAATAAAALVVGSVTVAYAASHVLAFAAAYGGWWWLARMAGLGPWWSHAPAVVFVTSPYYLALVYWRGDWPEHMAVSMMPLLIASALSVLRADRLRPLPVLALAVSAILFFGSHNITLLWGATIAALLAAALCLAVPAARRRVTRRGLLRVAGVMAPALLVNAWFLLPDIAYASHTYIGADSADWRATLRNFDELVAPARILSPGRSDATPVTPSFALQLPVLAMAWTVAGLAVLSPRWTGSWTRTLLVLLTAVVGLVVLMTSAGLLLALPGPYGLIQFSFRLESYVVLVAAAAVLAALVLAGEAPPRRRRWRWAILPVLAVSVAQAAAQGDMRRTPISRVTPWPTLPAYHTPSPAPGMADYVGHDLPLIATPGVPVVTFAPSAEDGDRASATVGALPGQVLATNAMTVPQLVDLSGARFVGIDAGRHNVVELDADVTPGAARITMSAAHPLPVVLGQVLSLIGIAGLAANGFAMLAAARRRRV